MLRDGSVLRDGLRRRAQPRKGPGEYPLGAGCGGARSPSVPGGAATPSRSHRARTEPSLSDGSRPRPTNDGRDEPRGYKRAVSSLPRLGDNPPRPLSSGPGAGKLDMQKIMVSVFVKTWM